jgi:hypothetical protein
LGIPCSPFFDAELFFQCGGRLLRIREPAEEIGGTPFEGRFPRQLTKVLLELQGLVGRIKIGMVVGYFPAGFLDARQILPVTVDANHRFGQCWNSGCFRKFDLELVQLFRSRPPELLRVDSVSYISRMQADADAPTLTEGQLLILQTLDNEIEACVHLHAHTATVLASCNFFRTAAELLGRNADSPAEAVVYLSGLGLVAPQATVWADLAAQANAKDATRHSVSEAEAARLASLARVILTAMRRAFGIYERAIGDTIHSKRPAPSRSSRPSISSPISDGRRLLPEIVHP